MSKAPMPIARGAIYEITLTDDIVWCRVWRDSALDEATGAACAAEMLEHVVREALHPATPRLGFILDVREAPPAFGPKTEASMTTLFSLTRQRGRRSAVVTGKAMQELQYTRLCGAVARTCTRVTPDPAIATAFVAGADS